MQNINFEQRKQEALAKRDLANQAVQAERLAATANQRAVADAEREYADLQRAEIESQFYQFAQQAHAQAREAARLDAEIVSRLQERDIDAAIKLLERADVQREQAEASIRQAEGPLNALIQIVFSKAERDVQAQGYDLQTFEYNGRVQAIVQSARGNYQQQLPAIPKTYEALRVWVSSAAAKERQIRQGLCFSLIGFTCEPGLDSVLGTVNRPTYG